MENKDYAREWRNKNREKIAAYRKANKERRAAQDREWRAKNAERIAGYRGKSPEYQREWRKKNKTKANGYQRAYRAGRRDRVRAQDTKHKRTHRERHPERQRARYLLGRAVKAGKVVRPGTCSRCGAVCIPHGHHPDYLKALDVIWLCNPCHLREHGKEAIPLLGTALGC